jgi:hypothetical protein
MRTRTRVGFGEAFDRAGTAVDERHLASDRTGLIAVFVLGIWWGIAGVPQAKSDQQK